MSRNKKIIVSVGIIISLVLLVLLGTKYIEKNSLSTITGGGVTSPDQFPTGPTITVTASDGDPLKIRNFLEDPSTTKDLVNKDFYYLGYHLNQGSPGPSATDDPPYVISYISTTNFFNIVLLKNPIMVVRLEAEGDLQKRLGILPDQLCQLKYTISVPNRVNQFYAGLNLGFSFCSDGLAEARDTYFREVFDGIGGKISAPVCATSRPENCTFFGNVNPDVLSVALTLQEDCKKNDPLCQITLSSGGESRQDETLIGGSHVLGDAFDMRAAGVAEKYIRTLFRVTSDATITPSTTIKYSGFLPDNTKIEAYRIDTAHWHIGLVR